MTEKPPATFRRLTADDLGSMRGLLGVFGEVFDMPETYIEAQPDDAYLTDLLNTDHFFAVAAFAGETMIGGLTAYEFKKYEQARSEFYIYDLAVAEEHRRRGVATGLIMHLKSIARARGAYVVIIQADYGDEPPINLYSKLGTKEQILHFDIKVDQA